MTYSTATKDQHYAVDWEIRVKFDGLKHQLAASRDGQEGIQRTYVQRPIKQDAEHISMGCDLEEELMNEIIISLTEVSSLNPSPADSSPFDNLTRSTFSVNDVGANTNPFDKKQGNSNVWRQDSFLPAWSRDPVYVTSSAFTS